MNATRSAFWPENVLASDSGEDKLRRILEEEKAVLQRFITNPDKIYRYRSSPNLHVAVLSSPPISGGMMDTLEKLSNAVVASSEICKKQTVQGLRQLKEIPLHLLHFQELLKDYYSYQVFGHESADLQLCDMPFPGQVAYMLAYMGEVLRVEDRSIRVLMQEVTEFRELIFEDYVPGKEMQGLIDEYEEARFVRPPMAERRNIFARQVLREAYRANIIWNYFRGPILEWCITSSHARQRLPHIANKGLEALQRLTSRPDAFYTAGVLVYEQLYHLGCERARKVGFQWEQFLRKGGLPAMLNATLICSFDHPSLLTAFGKPIFYMNGDELTQSLQPQPKEVHENIILILEYFFDLENYEASRFIQKPSTLMILRNELATFILYALYCIIGPDYLRTFAIRAWFNPKLGAVLSRAEKLNPRTEDDFAKIYRKFTTQQPDKSRRRLLWLWGPTFETLKDVDLYGCSNTTCPMRIAFKRELRTRGPSTWNEFEDSKRLIHFMTRLKYCGRCHKAAYCSRKCQREHWRNQHYSKCVDQGEHFAKLFKQVQENTDLDGELSEVQAVIEGLFEKVIADTSQPHWQNKLFK